MTSPVTLYVTRAPAGSAPPYAVLHFAPDVASATSANDKTDWRSWMFVTHSVGSDADQCEWVRERLEAALLDHAPTVAGRSCDRITRLGSGVPPEVDNDVQPPLVLARDTWVFASVPNQ